MNNKNLILAEDPSDGVASCSQFYPRPWKVEVRKRIDRRYKKGGPGMMFAIVAANGRVVKTHGNGQYVLHLIVDLVNRTMV